MTFFQPKPISTDIVDEINRLVLLRKPVDDFTSQRLLAGAKKVIGIEPAVGYQISGMVMGLTRNYASMREYFEKALKIEPRNPTILGNFATALDAAGYFTDALDAIQRAHNVQPDNIETLERAINYAVLSCRFGTAKSLLSKLHKLVADKDSLGNTSSKEVLNLFERHSDMPIEEIDELLARIGQFVRERNLIVSSATLEDLSIEGDVPLLFTMFSPVSVAEAAELNFDLADALVEKLQNGLADRIIFRFSPIRQSEEALTA